MKREGPHVSRFTLYVLLLSDFGEAVDGLPAFAERFLEIGFHLFCGAKGNHVDEIIEANDLQRHFGELMGDLRVAAARQRGSSSTETGGGPARREEAS